MQQIDGISFLSILKNKKQSDHSRPLVWHFPNKWISKDDHGINYRSAIRQGDWKLIYNMKAGSKELYNLKTDIGEQNDLSSKYPVKVKQLSCLLSQKLKSIRGIMETHIRIKVGKKGYTSHKNYKKLNALSKDQPT